MTTLNLTWVPSKTAVETGIVPDDYKKYDIDVLSYLTPDLADMIRAEAPAIFKSVETAATRAFRHAFNNECASKWGAAVNPKAKKDGSRATPVEDTVENRAKFLDEWRTAWRTEFVEGNLGIRQTAPVITKDELSTEMDLIAFNRVKAYVLNKGGEFTYNVVSARSLAAMVGESGKNVGEWMTMLLEKNGEIIRAEAQKVIDQRNAAKDNTADFDMDGMFDEAAE